MKIKEWIKENWIFLGILLFALIIRIYYFSITNGQPLWWDECEYLNMARVFASGGEYTFGPVRPILFSLISSLFLIIVKGEILPRLLILAFSLASVIGMYYFGKEIYDKKDFIINLLDNWQNEIDVTLLDSVYMIARKNMSDLVKQLKKTDLSNWSIISPDFIKEKC